MRLITTRKPKVWKDQYLTKGEEGLEGEEVLDEKSVPNSRIGATS